MSFLKRSVPYLGFGFLSLHFESGCVLFVVFYAGTPICFSRCVLRFCSFKNLSVIRFAGVYLDVLFVT